MGMHFEQREETQNWVLRRNKAYVAFISRAFVSRLVGGGLDAWGPSPASDAALLTLNEIAEAAASWSLASMAGDWEAVRFSTASSRPFSRE
jgi:hypothetical protein